MNERPIEDAIAASRLHVEPQAQTYRVYCEPSIDARLLEPEFSVRRYERPNMFFGAPKLAGIVEGRLIGLADQRRYGGIEYV